MDSGSHTEEETDNSNAIKDQPRAREKIAIFIHNKRTHAVSLFLVVLDALLVLILLLVDLDVIPISSKDGEGHVDESKKHMVENILHYTGLSILSVFIVEIILKLVADGLNYFKKKLEVFDGIIVLLSFVLDLVLTVSPVSKYVRDAVILMILLRLWRFFKLIAAVNICARKEIQDEFEMEKSRRKLAEKERTQAEKERDEALFKLKQCQEHKGNCSQTTES